MFDLIGKTVGPYRILEQAGAGGMATVYKAYQPNMDRYIAVKVLPMHLSKDPEFTKRFQREARAIARLEHAHILPVYDYGEYEGITYLAMRYIKAGTLKDRMSAGQLSLDDINNVISQIGSALDYAHRMGVIHRDIKPGNVLMDEQGDVYLSDFGLARMMEQSQQLTGSGVGLGTPAYMSPEQGQGNKIDHRTDIYALGIILYEMLTGRVPYKAETPMAVVLKHIQGDLPLPHNINPNTPEPVEKVILKALAKDPADRYQTAGEMVQALNFAVRTMSAEAQQETMIYKVAPAQQDVSIVTKIQRLWDRPRGRLLLTSGTLAMILLLGFLLMQLPGSINIFASNANQDNKPVVSLETQAATKESSDQSTAVPVTTITQSATTASESSTQSINSLYDDFNNPIYDGKFDSTKWSLQEDYKGACNTVQQDGHLTITHTPSSSLSGCVLDGSFSGVGGNKFQSFEAKMFVSNDFQGTCCGYLSLTLGSSSFSGGGGWIECALHPEPGRIAGVFGINHGGGTSEFSRQLETTFNSWHTLRLQIEQNSYTVSCYVDDRLIGSVVPKDASSLKDSNFGLYLQAGWPENSTGTYQLDDVQIGTIQPSTSTPEVTAEPATTPAPQFSSPIGDVRVRQAIAYCTDRRALAQSVNPTFTSSQIDELMMDSFLPKTHWAYSQPATQYPFDPAAGQALLEQAGWTGQNGQNYRTNSQGEELRLELTTTPAEFRKTWAEVFETQMQSCGIHLIRLHVDPNWLFGENTGIARREFQLGAWSYDVEENPDVSSFFGCDSIPTLQNGWQGQNLVGWCNQTASEAAKKAIDLSLSQNERKQFFTILQEEFAKDLPWLPLFLRDNGIYWEHIEFNLSK